MGYLEQDRLRFGRLAGEQVGGAAAAAAFDARARRIIKSRRIGAVDQRHRLQFRLATGRLGLHSGRWMPSTTPKQKKTRQFVQLCCRNDTVFPSDFIHFESALVAVRRDWLARQIWQLNQIGK